VPDPLQEAPVEEFEDFICTCSDEGRQRGAALMDEVRGRLSTGSEELMPRQVENSNLLTMVVTSLNWDFDARITQIANDQWSGVWAETYKGDFKTRIECDLVEHGIAATWKAFADRAQRPTAQGEPSPASG